MGARLRLHHRIVIPFVLVALVATSAAAYIALSAASAAMERRVQGQLLSAAAVVSRADFAMSPAILRSVRDITGLDVVTFTGDGDVLASTVDEAELPSLLARLLASRHGANAPADRAGSAAVRIDCGGVPCFVAFRRVDGYPETTVALVAETSELVAGTQAVTRTILIAAAMSVIIMIVASQLVARRVTAPLARLSDFARELTLGGSHQRAPVGDDEVGRLASAFNEMLDRVEHSQEALVRSEKLALAGLLAARVAHDIRNPLSSIKMQAQLLRTDTLTPDQQAGLGAILHDIDQVESVISDLLELARPGAPARQAAQLNTVVREALQQMSLQLAYRKIAVEVALDETLPLISLDTNRVKQALLNVLMNASEAMPTGGTLRVASRSAGDAVLLEVCDDGIGVDPDMIQRVFDPFVSTKRDGVGLGLVNAKAVVESHGGTIALERREPTGTCVRISLPAHAPAPADGGHMSAHDG